MTPVLSLPSFTGNRNNIDIFLYNWRALLSSCVCVTVCVCVCVGKLLQWRSSRHYTTSYRCRKMTWRSRKATKWGSFRPMTGHYIPLFAHRGGDVTNGWIPWSVASWLCVSVCLFVRALKRKRPHSFIIRLLDMACQNAGHTQHNKQ